MERGESLMKDNRKHKRFTLDVMEVNGNMTRATDVRIIDISLGGISIKADRRLNLDTEYLLKLTDKNNKVLSLKGTVIWSLLSETKATESEDRIPIYQAGMRFTNLDEKGIAELVNFIERNRVYELPEPQGRRINLRFRIKGQDKAILESPENFRVREISLGGLRIDSDYSMEIDSKMTMELFMPDDRPIRFIGRIASCRVLNPDRYAVGIEIVDLTAVDREILADLIDSCEALVVDDNG